MPVSAARLVCIGSRRDGMVLAPFCGPDGNCRKQQASQGTSCPGCPPGSIGCCSSLGDDPAWNPRLSLPEPDHSGPRLDRTHPCRRPCCRYRQAHRLPLCLSGAFELAIWFWRGGHVACSRSRRDSPARPRDRRIDTFRPLSTRHPLFLARVSGAVAGCARPFGAGGCAGSAWSSGARGYT